MILCDEEHTTVEAPSSQLLDRVHEMIASSWHHTKLTVGVLLEIGELLGR
jgi:hypothetical protein